MSRVKDGPTIHIRPETHKKLGRVKNELELKSLDEAIKSLLARPDFTEGEVAALITVIVCEDWSEGYEDNTREHLKSVELKLRKCIQYYYEKSLDECQDERCKSGKHAGEELRKKLLEDTGLPEAPPINSRCLSEEDTRLKEYFKRQKEAENEWKDSVNEYVVKALAEGAKK